MLLKFFNTVANLKDTPRQGWIDKLGIEKPESVSDHTYLMTMMAMVFSEIKNLDTLKVIKMSLLHDLAESYVGDLTLEKISKNKKDILENDAIEKILKDLPRELTEEYSNLWKEYQTKSSSESNLVHEVDKLEMALQAKIYEKKGFSEIDSFLKTTKEQIKDPSLKKLFIKICDQR